jgi:cyclic-di-GMP-binding protein
MLAFSLPQADPAVQDTVETRPKTLAAWLDRLPYASPPDAAQQLVAALYALNRHPLGADERHALLTLYRPVIVRVAASLETLLAESGVPPYAQQRQIGTLLRDLQSERSLGYKHLLMALTDQRFGRPNLRRLAEFTAQATVALRDMQTASFLTYTPPPAGLWQELHQLHAYAQVMNVAELPTDGVPTVSLSYRQALLIALADPPHLSPVELAHTRLYLDRFAALAVLTTGPVADHLGFPVSTEGDTPPTHVAAGRGPGGLWLDTDTLCRHVHETAVRLRKGETPEQLDLPPGIHTLSLTLCKRLLKEWGSTAQRTYKRYPTAPDSTMQIVAGVSAIHRLLEQVPCADQAEPDESLPIHDVQGMFASPTVVNATVWSVTNDSAAGVALTGAPDAPLNLKVGDPLALLADTAVGWALGAIRWILMRDARRVELGVERLSPQIQPVWVRPLRGHRKASPEPALFLPGLAALKQTDRLLLPRHLYESGMDAEVLHAPRHYTLSFGRLLEHTPGFDLIDFSLIADEPL